MTATLRRLVCAAVFSAALFAQEVREVVITQAGKRYHTSVCMAVKGRKTTKISLQEATQARKLDSCKICAKTQLSAQKSVKK